MAVRNPQVLRQVLPILVASITGVSFGTMLGWPSICFPILVDPENTPIPITWDQSAFIAGFLMWGNIFGTSFSHVTFLGTKIGILCGFASQVAGWISMYFTVNIPELLISRGLVGMGNGFALGQMRMYVQQTCDPKIGKVLMQYNSLSTNIGVIIVYCIGTFATFQSLSIYCGIIPALGFILFAAIPKRPYAPTDNDNVNTVQSVCQTKERYRTKEEEANQGNEDNSVVNSAGSNGQIGFIAGFKDKNIRTSIFVLWCLIFIPQYSGGAANVVYNQVMHMAALNPYPKVCGIIYAFVFLFSNIVALRYTNKFPRKPVLVACCIISGLLLVAVCFYYYFLVDLLEVSPHFVWSPLIILSIFNFFHTMGVNTVPLLYITDKFPPHARTIGNKFYVMYFSLSALLSTKVFQVMFTYYGMHMAYIFTSSVAIGCGLLVLLFFREPSESKIKSNLQGFENNVDEKEEAGPNDTKPSIKDELKDTLKARYVVQDEMNKRNKMEDLKVTNLKTNRFEVIEACPNTPDVPHRNAYYQEVDLSDEISTCPKATSSPNCYENENRSSIDAITEISNDDSEIEHARIVAKNIRVTPQRKLFKNRPSAPDDVISKL